MQKLNASNKEGGSTLRNGGTSGITVFSQKEITIKKINMCTKNIPTLFIWYVSCIVIVLTCFVMCGSVCMCGFCNVGMFW
jgi:hypothetical protein